MKQKKKEKKKKKKESNIILELAEGTINKDTQYDKFF